MLMFDIQGSTPSCLFDYVEVFDGQGVTSRSFGRFCGNMFPRDLTSSSNYMYIVFTTDSSGTYKGFSGNYFTRGRSSIIQADNGNIVSPGFPIGYQNNMYFTWTIVGSPGTFITLNFTTLDLGGSLESCVSDYIELHDGAGSGDPRYPKLCGSVTPGLLASTSNYMYLVFRTDASVTRRGFNVTFYTQGQNILLQTPAGDIVSPGFPIRYLNNKDYRWTISGTYGSYLVLNITMLDLGSISAPCSNDYLEFYDAANQALGRVCGNVSPVLITSTNEYMKIVFRSDSSATFKGFSAHFSSQGSTLEGSSGVLISPGFPFSYKNSAVYSWFITGIAGSFIVLNIDVLDIQGPSPTCSFDYLQIVDSDGSTQLARLCGSGGSIVTASTGTSMSVYFRTDNSVVYKGFTGNYYTQSSSSTLRKPSGYLVSPGFPRFFLNNKVYDWTVEGTGGAFVIFNLPDFYIRPFWHATKLRVPKWI
ncbi:tolloid-like protein 1 [Physella acuta]|uniref:tolloid-like protein 1 n=1 Tax=Physella acuta TaxID=109671 RepID=UPI0027DE3E9C|nr:tolloid-like protein 1 [Physella acuta]